MNGKEKVLSYCNQFTNVSVEHIENARENAKWIAKEQYRNLNGCPSSYGLNEFEGLCYEEQLNGTEEQSDQCEKCWRVALNVQGDHHEKNHYQ